MPSSRSSSSERSRSRTRTKPRSRSRSRLRSRTRSASRSSRSRSCSGSSSDGGHGRGEGGSGGASGRRAHAAAKPDRQPSKQDNSKGRKRQSKKKQRRKRSALSPGRAFQRAIKYVTAERSKVRKLERLLRRHPGSLDLSAEDSQGQTLLHKACDCGRAAAVAWLLARGLSATQADVWGDTPAHLAARRGHLGALAEIIKSPTAPGMDAAGRGGVTLRQLMEEALRPPSAAGGGNGGAGAAAQRGEGGEEQEEDAGAAWRQRLREECSDDELAGGAAGGGLYDGTGVFGPGGETDDEWSSRLWREMMQRRTAAARSASAAFVGDMRADAKRRAQEAAQRSAHILQEERAKDAEWRRRAMNYALLPGPAAAPVDLLACRAQYEARWRQLEAAQQQQQQQAARGSAAAAAAAPVAFADVPWPLQAPSAGAGDTPPPLTLDLLRDFMLLGCEGPADVKKRLRTELLRWHPDKFAARFGARLDAAAAGERARVLQRVKEVSQMLTQLLAG